MINEPDKLNRREFIKESVVGISGMAMLHTPKQNLIPFQKRDKKIVYRTLGKTGYRLPLISIGSDGNSTLYNSALDSGIAYIHTSSTYREGLNEETIGKVIKNRSRDSFVIGTGFWAGNQLDARTGSLKRGRKAGILRSSIEGSLKRLNVEYSDIYYLTDIQNRKMLFYEPFMKLMESFKKEGKTRYIGVICHGNEPEVIRAAIDSKIYDVVLTSYNFRQNHREEVKSAIADAVKAGIGIAAMKTQVGKYWERNQREKINMKAALRWVLQDENVSTALMSFSSFDEMNEGLSVMENLTLTEQEKNDLRKGDEKGYSGLYCQQCGKCISQCKENFDIPALMRCYMYAYGYKQPMKAKETIKYIDLSNAACENCSSCSVTCTMNFNIRNKVLDIKRIKDVPCEFLG
ncbi:MAG: aldo/keto reductase [bacterium]|nr:aldo/keto reductase [bacterium]